VSENKNGIEIEVGREKREEGGGHGVGEGKGL
jgi:hypothetical protein